MTYIDDPEAPHDPRDNLYESPHAEHALLARLLSLTDPDTTVLDMVAPEDFSNGHVQEIWRASRTLVGRKKMVSPRNILNEIDTPPIRVILNQVSGSVATDTQVWEAAQQVRELADRRRIRGALVAAMERLESADSASEALEAAHQELARVKAGDTPQSEVVVFSDAVQRWREYQRDTTRRPVVPTSWDDLNDKLAGGLQGGRTYIVGARPGEGKSILGANAALYAAEQGFSALVFSAEMPILEVTSRMIAAGARADYGQITRRKIDQYNRDKVDTYLAEHETSLPLRIVDRSKITVEYIASKCRAVKRKHGLSVVFVDYLQLLQETDTKVARERQVAQMSRALKILAVELDVAIVIACQLNRGSTQGDGRAPALSDLRESGSIEQDADVVILLHHEAEGEVRLILAKNRTGSLTTITQGWAPFQARIA